MRVLLAVFVFVVFSLPAIQARAEDQKPLEVIRFTPDGNNVPSTRQLAFTFNRPVVPLGRMERTADEIPVTITPALECEWRWKDTSTLLCQLGDGKETVLSTKYNVTMQPGIMAEDGATLTEPFVAEFVTQRPDVRYHHFKTWRAPGHPVMRLTFNQPVTKKSATAALTLVSEHGKVIAVKLAADPDDSETPSFIPLPGESGGFLFFGSGEKRKSDEQLTKKNGLEARRIWLLEPAEELGLDEQVMLKLSPGLVSALGDEKSTISRDVVVFQTFPNFALVGMRCFDNDNNEILIKEGDDPKAAGKLCDPLGPIALQFSTPVQKSQIKKHVVFNPPLGSKEAADDIWGSLENEYSRLNRAHRKENTYDVYLPQGLKAAQSYTITLEKPQLSFFGRIVAWFKRLFGGETPQTLLEDEFSATLPQGFKLSFATDHRRPNFELNHHNAVLESGVDSDVPLYVNNLETTTFEYKRLTAKGAAEGQKHTEQIAAVQDVQFAKPFGVRDMLDGQSGAVYGFLQTEPYVRDKPYYDRKLFAQITPWQMHVKLGHFSTLVWLTDMATGAPVSGATVKVYRGRLVALAAPRAGEIFARAVTDDNGLALLPGNEELDPDQSLARNWGDEESKLFVRADKGNDMALMPLSYDFGINTWRISNENIYARSVKRYGHMMAWGATAQGIYRAGDTMQYKIYVRQQNDRGFVPAPRNGYTLDIVDPKGNVAKTIKDIRLNAFGAYDGEFTVAEKAPVGWYRFRLKGSFSAADADDEEGNDGKTWEPIRVLVSDFTPAPFRVTTTLNGDAFENGQEVTVESGARMHAGGPYTDAQARITASINPRYFSSKHPNARKFYFSTEGQSNYTQQVFQTSGAVDHNGDVGVSFKLEQPDVYYGTLTVETAVRDDRGKYVASAATADYAGVDRFVGLRNTEWVYTAKKDAAIEYIAVDAKGKPVAGTKTHVLIEREVTNAAKVKGAGNAYLTHYTTSWEKVAACDGKTEEVGKACTFTPPAAGSYRATASIEDTKGRSHQTEMRMWVSGRDYVMWNESSDTLLTIISEETSYKTGDTARYLVKNPWPGAEALVTVERYGIIDTFRMKLEGSTPIIELPIKPDYVPGFYLSIMVTSPRAADKPMDGGVDLGKPSFRMGYTTVNVTDPYKEIVVEATADQEVYRPRDKVTVDLSAVPRHPNGSEPVEIAVAVLDEAVFDLIAGGKDAYDPYKGFYKLQNLDVQNYNLLTQLIGRQKFEKKGANQGGDGGSDLSVRDLFKFVAYWNPSVRADGNGKARVTFDLPDNLTGWRVLAMAVTPSDRMGLGQGTFKVNRPTELRPVMPNQVTERDSFKAGFSVMNRTDQPRTLTVNITAKGPIDAAKHPATLTEAVVLEPYKRKTVYMPIATIALPETADVEKGAIAFTATAKDDVDGDGLQYSVPVHKMRSLETAANYGTTTEDKVTESIAFPENIFPDVGGISVVLSPSVISSVEGAFRYMRDYPYFCWEQILTKGVMAAHYQSLKAYMPDSFKWEGSDKLTEKMLKDAASFQAPSGGMAYFYAHDSYVSPYLSAYTALAFTWLKAAGYDVPQDVAQKLQGYLQNFLKNDTAPSFYSEGMRSTVRAVMLAALSADGKLSMDDLQRYRPHVDGMSLFGKAHYLRAALGVKDGKDVALETAKKILAHGNQTAGKFMFNEELDDSYARILATPLRENCAILDSFTVLAGIEDGRKLVGDVPFRLVRTITQTRKNRDHWENTQENMFCMNALAAYSRVYENVKPDMVVKANLNGENFGKTKFTDLRDDPVTFEKPLTPENVGQKATVDITRKGDGRLYHATRLRYAPRSDFSKPVNAGMEVKREYSVERDGKWVLLNDKDSIKRGELVRVDLYLSLPAARNFVVVNDPLPGGLETVNKDLATASAVDADKGAFEAAGGSWFFKFRDWRGYNASRWSFYHKEMRHDRVVFYSDYLPPGNYHLSYTAQAIAEGQFSRMPTLAEEMYDPDVYGKSVMGELDVTAADTP